MAINNFIPKKYYILSSKEETNGEIIELNSKFEFNLEEKEKMLQLQNQ